MSVNDITRVLRLRSAKFEVNPWAIRVGKTRVGKTVRMKMIVILLFLLVLVNLGIGL